MRDPRTKPYPRSGNAYVVQIYKRNSFRCRYQLLLQSANADTELG